MPIADALILTFPPKTNLRWWASIGLAERESHLIRAMLAHHERIFVLAPTGGADVLAPFLSVGERARVRTMDIESEFAGGMSLDDALVEELRDARTVVLQTRELVDGGLAESLVPQLRRASVRTALVAKGGFLPSQVLAAKLAPHDPRTISAGLEEQSLCTAAQIVVGASSKMLADLTWRLAIDPARTRLVPNFVIEDGDPSGPSERDADLLLTWGPLSKPQQVEVLVRALTLVQEPWRSRVRLEVAGDGPERPALEALAGELGVDVRFLGELGHAELRAKMRECSLYLHAAAHNPEALGVLDAMSVGCPVVLANQPGVAEFVENGVNGIRVDATADAFAYAISGMLPDEDWRETLSACASQQIRSRSSLERVGGLLAEAHGAALELAGHATASRAIA